MAFSTDVIRSENTAPSWLKVTTILGVIWYAFGLLQFWLGFNLDTQSAIGQGAITAAHGAAIASTPLVVWLAFALASASGLVGAVFLFLRSPAAKPSFLVSLAMGAFYYLWVYAISGTGADRPSEESIIAVVVIAVTLGFAVLSRRVS